MATPLSLSPAPLTGLGDHSYKSLLDDDFSIGKLSLKAKVASPNGGVANYKYSQTVGFNKAAEEVKVQFPWRNYYLWFGSRPNELKFHVDLGEYEWVAKENFFFNVRKRVNEKPEFRFGSVYTSANLLNHTRLRFNSQTETWSILNRTAFRRNEHLFNAVLNFNFLNRAVDAYDWVYGYQTREFDLYLRHHTLAVPQVPVCCNYGIGRVVADVVYRRAGNTFGAEFNLEKKFGLTVGVGTNVRNHYVKARVNVLDQVLGFSAKGKFNKTFGYSVATQINLKGDKVETGVFPVPLGFTLEVNA